MCNLPVSTLVCMQSPTYPGIRRLQHPEAKVYNQCMNLTLESAVNEYKNGRSLALKSLGTGTPLQSLPQPGDVDVIAAGPPCTGYSGLNRSVWIYSLYSPAYCLIDFKFFNKRFKSERDVRNTLIATCLSYVEHFRPSYVVIENVANMAKFKLAGKERDGKIAGGIEWGTAKFVLRTFLDLGQVATTFKSLPISKSHK